MVWEKREEMEDDGDPIFGSFLPHPEKGGLGVIGMKSDFVVEKKHAGGMKTLLLEALTGFDNDPIYLGGGKKSTIFFTAEKEEHIKPILERIQARIKGMNTPPAEETPASLKRWKKKRAQGKLCVRCLKIAKHKCSCLKERYCSKECQKEDWKCHKLIHNKD